jgi:hypothetical protein
MTNGTNGTVTSPSQEVLRYAAGVRAELADLSPAQRDELLEDLEDHLSEVAAELDEPLESRLGPPEAYADELRASAALAPPPPVPSHEEGRVGRASSRLRNSAPVRGLRSFLPELQPAWWVVRGLLVGLILLPSLGLFPALVFGAAAIVVSVLLGRRTQGRRGPWVLALLGNLAAVVVALYLLVTLASVATSPDVEASAGSGVIAPERLIVGGTLRHEDGSPITNIFPYDAQGQPLSGVRLYDQDGRPITNVSNFTEDGRPIRRTYPVEPNGLRVRNAYPQELVILDQFGQPTQVPTTPPTPSPSVSPEAPN